MLLLLLTACAATAPEDIEDMLVYGFVHQPDERDNTMVSLSKNLIPWLEDHFDEATEGYGINRLTAEDLEDAGVDAEIDGDGIVGAVTGIDYAVSIDELAWGLTYADQSEVFSKYLEYEGVDIGDRDCFLSRECDRMSITETIHADLGVLGVESFFTNTFEIRWVDLGDERWAFATRTLGPEPVEFTVDWLKVYQQYAFTFGYPREDGTVRRAQAVWAESEIVGADVPEDFQINTAISTMQSAAAEMEAFLQAR